MSEALNIPEGFKPRQWGGGMIALVGPLYTKRVGEEGVRVGIRVEERHCNPRNIMHGGMIATFADMLLPIGASLTPGVMGRFLTTVTLQVDYMAAVPLGAWVEGQAEILKVTRTMLFTQGMIYADGVLCARVSGVFKLGQPLDEAEVKRRLEAVK